MTEYTFINGEWVPDDMPDVPRETPEQPSGYIFQGGEWAPEEIDYSLTETIKNIPGSAKKNAIEVWEGIKSLPEIAGVIADNPSVIKDIPGAIWDDLQDSYGGVERFQRTLQEDPVRVFADAIGAVGGTGLALKLGGKGVKNLGEGIYRTSSKFSPTLPIDEKKALNRSAIERGVSTTEKGTAKLSSRIKALNQKIEEILSNAQPGDIIPIDRVMMPIKETRQQLGGLNNLDAAKDLAKINRIEQEFRDYAWELGRDNFTVEELQNFKKNVYDTIKFDARKQKGTLAEEKTRKAIGRGAKEELEQAVPGIKELNKELSDLYELQPHVERAASRIDNRNYISLPGMGLGSMAAGFGSMSGGAGGLETGLSSLIGALVASTLMSPAVSQQAGRYGYKVGKALDRIPGNVGAGAPFIMPGRTFEDEE